MVSAVARQLITQFRLDARQVFQDARVSVINDLKLSSDLPVDTGRLRSKIIQRDAVLTGNVYKVEVVSTARASGSGVDYPAILENAKRIEPRKSKYLAWKSGGQDVVIQGGFDNKHYRWWTRLWGLAEAETLWDKALRQAFNRRFG